MNAIFNNVLLDGLSLPFAVEKICRLSPEWRSSSSSPEGVLKTVFALLLPSTIKSVLSNYQETYGLRLFYSNFSSNYSMIKDPFQKQVKHNLQSR